MTIQQDYEARVADGRLTRDPAQESVLPALERVRAALEQPVRRGFLGRRKPEAAQGLYLWGGVGRGKSMLMDMLVASVEAPKQRWHFHAFMQAVQKGLTAAREKGLDDALTPVAEEMGEGLRLLAFDEMQVTDIADAMILGRLFDKLHDLGVTVVTTSNRPPQDLYEDGLNRQLFTPFIARIEERLQVLELASDEDWRSGVLAQSGRYFTPANAEARAAIAKLWDELTGGAAMEPAVLKVGTRAVPLPGLAAGVARADFWDLCGRPLGAADYLALAEAVRVLILENVPRLSRDNFNEAKRFVTLIDTLYEAKTRLILSAADVPDSLYKEGEGAFEFARTASRLREMQGEGWGG